MKESLAPETKATHAIGQIVGGFMGSEFPGTRVEKLRDQDLPSAIISRVPMGKSHLKSLQTSRERLAQWLLLSEGSYFESIAPALSAGPKF